MHNDSFVNLTNKRTGIMKSAYNSEWITQVKFSENPKVLTMLSGGKDSIAATVLLKTNGIDVRAIHFLHKWSSEIPTLEAKRICSLFDIPLIIVDYTREFFNAINEFTGGRSCALCKLEMYKILIKKLDTSDYGWLCIGDNSNDRTTIARIKNFLAANGNNQSLECSSYFGSEMGIKLPPDIKVLRPLINMKAEEVENFLNKNNIIVQRINSTGDKYFEYHREGCPIQFADVGIPITEQLCDSLKQYNDLITQFARNKNILASIHIPSTFIVTIPRGHEKQAGQFLESNGLKIKDEINSEKFIEKQVFFALIDFVYPSYFTAEIYKKIFFRFLERLELNIQKADFIESNQFINCNYSDLSSNANITINKKTQTAEIFYFFTIESTGLKDFNLFDNLILELFRTRKYTSNKFSLGDK